MMFVTQTTVFACNGMPALLLVLPSFALYVSCRAHLIGITKCPAFGVVLKLNMVLLVSD
jgi:hypothetical protein